jgi:hypothetical protein
MSVVEKGLFSMEIVESIYISVEIVCHLLGRILIDRSDLGQRGAMIFFGPRDDGGM